MKAKRHEMKTWQNLILSLIVIKDTLETKKDNHNDGENFSFPVLGIASNFTSNIKPTHLNKLINFYFPWNNVKSYGFLVISGWSVQETKIKPFYKLVLTLI